MFEFHMIHDAPSLFPVGIIFVALVPYFTFTLRRRGQKLYKPVTSAWRRVGLGLGLTEWVNSTCTFDTLGCDLTIPHN